MTYSLAAINASRTSSWVVGNLYGSAFFNASGAFAGFLGDETACVNM